MSRSGRVIRTAATLLALLAACTCGTGNSGPEVTGPDFPADTDALVLGAVLDAAALASPTTVYRHPAALSAGEVVSAMATTDPGAAEDVEPLRHAVFTAAAPVYFYFVDYFTGYQYAHPVEYVFINAATGALTRIDGEWWPELNGAEVFYTAAQTADQGNIVRREFPPAPARGRLDWDSFGILPDAAAAAVRQSGSAIRTTSTTEQHVLILNGIDPTDAVRPAAEDAAAQAETALSGGGYESITKIDFKQGDPQPSPDDAARAARDAFFAFLENFDAPPDSNLTIYVVAHGSSSCILIGRKGSSSDFWIKRGDLKKALEKLAKPPRSIRIKLISQACYSGEYMKKLTGCLRVGIAAAGNHTATAMDIDPGATPGPGVAPGPDTNPGDSGPEFSSGYFEDYSAIQARLAEDADLLGRMTELALESGVPLEELILYASFTTALEKDAAAEGDGPRRHPAKFDNELLDRDDRAPADDAHTDNVPDWIEDLIGRETVPE
jgi:hypothetical protein